MNNERLSAKMQEILPKHKCGLSIRHNEHLDYYQTIKQFIEGEEHFDWPSEAEKQLALKRDEVWTIQWYPITPIGFQSIAFGSLESLLNYFSEGKHEQ